MPNRYVREAAIKSRAVNSLSWQGEVFWRRLLNRADDFGRYTADSELLRTDIFPRQLDRVREADIPRLLAECEKAGLLFVYSADTKPFLVMNQWEKGRAKKSSYPEPPPDLIERLQTYVYTCKHKHTHAPDSDSDSDTDAVSGSVGAHPPHLPEAERPDEKEVKDYCQMIGLAEWKGLDWLDEMKGGNWLDYQHRPVRDWRAMLRRVRTKWEADGRPSKPPSNRKGKRGDNSPNL